MAKVKSVMGIRSGSYRIFQYDSGEMKTATLEAAFTKKAVQSTHIK